MNPRAYIRDSNSKCNNQKLVRYNFFRLIRLFSYSRRLLFAGHLYGTPQSRLSLNEDAIEEPLVLPPSPTGIMVNDVRGALPPNFEQAITEDGQVYFVE